MHDPAGSAKPVVIITCDVGPDENPRYKKVIESMKELFKDHNLDALFVATNAPGHSAYNRVERRMAPLSRELAGVVLPHDGSVARFRKLGWEAGLTEKMYSSSQYVYYIQMTVLSLSRH